MQLKACFLHCLLPEQPTTAGTLGLCTVSRVSVEPHNNFGGGLTALPALSYRSAQRSERPSDLPNITQLAGGRAGLRIQLSLFTTSPTVHCELPAGPAWEDVRQCKCDISLHFLSFRLYVKRGSPDISHPHHHHPLTLSPPCFAFSVLFLNPLPSSGKLSSL